MTTVARAGARTGHPDNMMQSEPRLFHGSGSVRDVRKIKDSGKPKRILFCTRVSSAEARNCVYGRLLQWSIPCGSSYIDNGYFGPSSLDFGLLRRLVAQELEISCYNEETLLYQFGPFGSLGIQSEQ